jgi:hypothetical protein
MSTNADYYANLLILQYHGLPRAVGTVRAIANLLLAEGVALNVRSGFNVTQRTGDVLALLDELYRLESFGIQNSDAKREKFLADNEVPLAVGKQLDILGAYVGTPRTYQNFLGEGKVLGDGDYRNLLILAASNGRSNHSNGEIHGMLDRLFGEDLVPVEAPALGLSVMQIAYLVSIGIFSNELLQAALFHDVLPRPMAVQFVGFLAEGPPWFGFTRYGESADDPAHTVGFTTYGDWDTRPGAFVHYRTA